jgi:plastocyanin
MATMTCGGGGSPTDPGGSGGGGSGGGVQSGATITIGANGVATPSQVTINVGQGVSFTNSSNRTRNLFSDPHGPHSDCPAMNNINLLAPGQTKVTSAFTTARTCGFHDHDDPDNANVKGSIVIR